MKFIKLTFFVLFISVIDSCSYDSRIEFYVENNCSTDIKIVTMSLDSVPEIIDQIILEPNTQYKFGENYYDNADPKEAMNNLTTIIYQKRYRITKAGNTYNKDMNDPDIYTFESNGQHSGTSTLIITNKDF